MNTDNLVNNIEIEVLAAKNIINSENVKKFENLVNAVDEIRGDNNIGIYKSITANIKEIKEMRKEIVNEKFEISAKTYEELFEILEEMKQDIYANL